MKKLNLLNILLIVSGVILMSVYGEPLMRNIFEFIICKEWSFSDYRLEMITQSASIIVPVILLLKRLSLMLIGSLFMLVGFLTREVNIEG